MSFLAHPDYPQEPPEGECALVQKRSEEEEEERNRVCSEHLLPQPCVPFCGGANPTKRRKFPSLLIAMASLTSRRGLLAPSSIGGTWTTCLAAGLATSPSSLPPPVSDAPARSGPASALKRMRAGFLRLKQWRL
ncbi:hypothetical protein NL676_025359 [Syzygium grande]|nr:hypothetical protein NL676_025359 [Syzygium grande]